MVWLRWELSVKRDRDQGTGDGKGGIRYGEPLAPCKCKGAKDKNNYGSNLAALMGRIASMRDTAVGPDHKAQPFPVFRSIITFVPLVYPPRHLPKGL